MSSCSDRLTVQCSSDLQYVSVRGMYSVQYFFFFSYALCRWWYSREPGIFAQTYEKMLEEHDVFFNVQDVLKKMRMKLAGLLVVSLTSQTFSVSFTGAKRFPGRATKFTCDVSYLVPRVVMVTNPTLELFKPIYKRFRILSDVFSFT